jgi:hypothetical protein
LRQASLAGQCQANLGSWFDHLFFPHKKSAPQTGERFDIYIASSCLTQEQSFPAGGLFIVVMMVGVRLPIAYHYGENFNID